MGAGVLRLYTMAPHASRERRDSDREQTLTIPGLLGYLAVLAASLALLAAPLLTGATLAVLVVGALLARRHDRPRLPASEPTEEQTTVAAETAVE